MNQPIDSMIQWLAEAELICNKQLGQGFLGIYSLNFHIPFPPLHNWLIILSFYKVTGLYLEQIGIYLNTLEEMFCLI